MSNRLRAAGFAAYHSVLVAILAYPTLAEEAPGAPPTGAPVAVIAAPSAPPAQVTITFDRAELELIFNALMDRPAKEVIPLLGKLQRAAVPPGKP